MYKKRLERMTSTKWAKESLPNERKRSILHKRASNSRIVERSVNFNRWWSSIAKEPRVNGNLFIKEKTDP